MKGIKVRKEIEMKGEVKLRGRVMKIGGLKEKMIEKLRGGIKKVMIKEEKEKDMEEIKENVKKNIEIVKV